MKFCADIRDTKRINPTNSGGPDISSIATSSLTFMACTEISQAFDGLRPHFIEVSMVPRWYPTHSDHHRHHEVHVCGF